VIVDEIIFTTEEVATMIAMVAQENPRHWNVPEVKSVIYKAQSALVLEEKGWATVRKFSVRG
jgi:hypothetical protein